MAAQAKAATFYTDFSATGGTINDVGGQGTGFTTRLSGTGTGLAANDAKLDIDTAAGTLTLTDPDNTDINGANNVTLIEAPGINLSSLGFDGSQDFSVSATYVGTGVTQQYEQFGIYLGTSSANSYRAGLIRGTFAPDPIDNYVYNVTNIATADQFNNLSASSFPTNSTDTFRLSITRTSGAYAFSIENITAATPPVFQTINDPPTLLNLATDLTVGLYAMNTLGSTALTVVATDFSATVVPEPSRLALLAIGCVAMIRGRRKAFSAR